MKILLVGATGGTGRLAAQQAIDRGYGVVALVRRPEQIGDLPAGAVPVIGDVRDQVAVDTALAGVDAVICCLGVRKGQTPGTIRSTGTRALVARMSHAGVTRIVAISTVGVGESAADQSAPARFLWPRIVGKDRLSEAAAAESAIRTSGLSWTIVRPPRLIDAPVSTQVRIGPRVPTRLGSQLSRAELAAAMLDLIENRQWERHAVTVTR